MDLTPQQQHLLLSKLHQAFDIILSFDILGVGKVVLNVRFFVGSL
jgi:hypothetical protein